MKFIALVEVLEQILQQNKSWGNPFKGWEYMIETKPRRYF